MTQWSNWSPCSVTCGNGTMERRRFYLVKEDMALCNRTTDEVDACIAKFPDCDGAKASKNYSGSNPYANNQSSQIWVFLVFNMSTSFRCSL